MNDDGGATTDASFTCQARRAARAMEATGTSGVWRYWFRNNFV